MESKCCSKVFNKNSCSTKYLPTNCVYNFGPLVWKKFWSARLKDHRHRSLNKHLSSDGFCDHRALLTPEMIRINFSISFKMKVLCVHPFSVLLRSCRAEVQPILKLWQENCHYGEPYASKSFPHNENIFPTKLIIFSEMARQWVRAQLNMVFRVCGISCGDESFSTKTRLIEGFILATRTVAEVDVEWILTVVKAITRLFVEGSQWKLLTVQ